jgi:hypothetical protein
MLFVKRALVCAGLFFVFLIGYLLYFMRSETTQASRAANDAVRTWCRRRESEYSGVFKTRKLLTFRHAKNAEEHGEIAPNWNVSGTRDFSFVSGVLGSWVTIVAEFATIRSQWGERVRSSTQQISDGTFDAAGSSIRSSSSWAS